MAKVSKEFKIGIAFLLAIFMLYYGISFLRGINIFKSSNTYIVVFKDVTGLNKSTPVTINGYQIGLVSDMKLDPNNPKLILTYVNLDKDVKLPKGSKFYLDASLLGNASLMLEMGSNTNSYINPHDTIIGEKRAGLMDAADNIVPQVEQLLPKIDSILSGINTLVNNPALDQSLNNVTDITEDLAKSTKQLNNMMGNLNKDVPTITKNLASASTSLSNTAKEIESIDLKSTYNYIDTTARNMSYISSKIASKDNNVGLLLNDRSLYDSINSTLNNASLLLKDVRESPKKYINVKVF